MGLGWRSKPGLEGNEEDGEAGGDCLLVRGYERLLLENRYVYLFPL